MAEQDNEHVDDRYRRYRSVNEDFFASTLKSFNYPRYGRLFGTLREDYTKRYYLTVLGDSIIHRSISNPGDRIAGSRDNDKRTNIYREFDHPTTIGEQREIFFFN